ncbi:MAG TPA: lipopolysaccharide biosynthesis protein [Gemmatimonadales bacterium]|jgi:PST family polysaccharide transporter|nr:lipopolysaccharide biosynthesis protein [Gemmatimonadales bacterium]
MTSPDPMRPGAPPGLTQRAIGGMFWTFSGTGVQVVVQLVAIMALGRLITPAEFGLMGAATVVVACSQIVSQIGVGPAIIQRRDLETAHLRVAVTLSATLGLLLGAIVWFGAPAIAAFYRMPELVPVLRAVAFLFPLDGLNTVARSLLTRQLRFRLYVALDAGSFIVGYAVTGVLLAWLGFGVWALVGAQVAQVTLRTVVMYIATRHPLRPSLDWPAGRDLLSFGFGHSMAQIGTLIAQQGDNLVAGRWLGAEALGVYGRAYNLMVMPATAFGRIVNRVLFPVMSQVQDERDRLANAYERTLAIVALASLPLSAFLWVVAPELIPVVLGPAWGAVVLPFRMFTISLLFRMSSKVSDATTKAAGEVYKRAVIQFVYAGLVVVGAIVGQRWGVGGIAVGVSIAMGINWLSMAWLARTVTGLDWSRFTRAQMPAVLLAGVIGLGGVLGAEAGRAAHLGKVPILIVAGLVAATAAFAASRAGPAVFLGPHGAWAGRQAAALLRRRAESGVVAAAEPENLAPRRGGGLR